MRSLSIKPWLGGSILVLALLACSVFTPAALPAATPIQAASPLPIIETATALASPTMPAPTESPTLTPPTATPVVATLPALASPSIHQLKMYNATAGWALTDSGVARSLDGGKTWYDASPSGLGGTTPASAFFLDPDHAWAATMGTDPTNGTLYHTLDGGLSWKSVKVPFGGGSLHFTDATHGWALIGLNAGMSHESVAIFRSGDGGDTWARVFINDPGAPGASDSLPLVGDKNGVTALNNSRAWITGSQPSSDFIYVYISQDGGSTWAHQDLAIPAGYSGAQTGADLPVFFGDNGVLPVLLFAGSNGTEFYISADGGQSWKATTPVAQGGFLAVASAKDFFVWDGSAPLNASRDGGNTWATVTPNINIKDSMISMQFVDASTGWALTGDASDHYKLYKTVDGGVTWNVLVP